MLVAGTETTSSWWLRDAFISELTRIAGFLSGHRPSRLASASQVPCGPSSSAVAKELPCWRKQAPLLVGDGMHMSCMALAQYPLQPF
jgi:hypothetical protein